MPTDIVCMRARVTRTAQTRQFKCSLNVGRKINTVFSVLKYTFLRYFFLCPVMCRVTSCDVWWRSCVEAFLLQKRLAKHAFINSFTQQNEPAQPHWKSRQRPGNCV